MLGYETLAEMNWLQNLCKQYNFPMIYPPAPPLKNKNHINFVNAYIEHSPYVYKKFLLQVSAVTPIYKIPAAL